MQPLPATESRRGNLALCLFVAVNLLNYIDRQMLYAVFPLLKRDFALSDAALGALGSAFMVSYLVTAPLFGWLGDRGNRVRLAAGGFLVWTCTTALSGLAGSYRALLFARSAVGVGEASFGTVSPGLLADCYPDRKRGHLMAMLYLAIPVGSALGYILGGVIGARWGWHAAFLAAGVGGLALAIPLAMLKEPPRGGGGDGGKANAPPAAKDYLALLRNRPYVLNTAAMTAMTFAMGGLAQWAPTFLVRDHGIELARGNTIFGGLTVVAGIAGTLAGGWLGEKARRRRPDGHLLVSGFGFLAGVPIAAWAILTPSTTGCLAAIFLAELFLFLNTAPLNTTTLDVTDPAVHSMAFAANIFVIHALGDALSPTLLGWLSDRWGLRHALLVTPAALAVAGAFCFLCAKSVREAGGGKSA
jgi:predicted MFS family arabinose efflux permease